MEPGHYTFKWWKDLMGVRDELKLTLLAGEIDSAARLPHAERTQMLYHKLQHQGRAVPWGPMVWNKLNIPKVSFIAWLVYMGRVLTKDRVSKFKPGIDDTCGLCGMEPESGEHLFFQCRFAREVLEYVMSRTEFHCVCIKLSGWIGLFQQARTCNTLYQLRSAALNMCIYMVWWARNQKVFQGTIVDAGACGRRATRMLLWYWSGKLNVNRKTRLIVENMLV